MAPFVYIKPEPVSTIHLLWCDLLKHVHALSLKFTDVIDLDRNKILEKVC